MDFDQTWYMIFKVIGQIFRGGDMPRFALPLFIYCIHGEFYLFKGGEFNLIIVSQHKPESTFSIIT